MHRIRITAGLSSYGKAGFLQQGKLLTAGQAQQYAM